MCVGAVIPAPVLADGAVKAALSLVPADAVGFLCVPSVKQLDADFVQATSKLGLGAMMPPPFNSPTAVVKQYLKFGNGFDESGPMVYVALSANTLPEVSQKMALIVAATDPKAFIESMGGEALEDGLWRVNMMGQPAVAAVGEKRVILAQSPAGAKAIASSKSSITDKFNAADLNTLEGLDLVLWVDGAGLIKLAKQQIDMIMGMAMMAQSAQGPSGAKQAEAMKKQVDTFVDGASSISFGLGLGDQGLTMRMGFRAKPGSELAKNMKVRNTSDSLLRGLPSENYLFALGQTVDPAVAKESMQYIEPYLSMVEGTEGVDKEQVGKLRGQLSEWVTLTTAGRMVVTALPPGPDGVLGFAMVLDTENSGKWIDMCCGTLETVKKLPKADSPTIDEELKQALSALIIAKDAEELVGAKVQHVKFDLSKVEEVDEEDVEQLNKVLGRDGLVARAAAANPQTVVITVGGGAKYMSGVLDQVKSKSATLDGEAGIQKVAAVLPKERYMVGYVDVDRIIESVRDVMKVLEEDEEEFPVRMAKIDAPLAIVGSGGEDWSRMDIFFPNELMLATKDAVMAMTGPGGAPPPPSAPKAPSGGQ